MSDWSYWRTHFEMQADRPLPMIVGASGTWPEGWRASLARSLAIFQLGESGEGRIAQDIDHCTLPSVDADYRASLKLFVEEEHRHAKILARMVLELKGRLLERSWSERLFCYGRRMLGIRFKLLVLLAAEVIGIAFYGTIATRLPLGSMRFALAEICRDEEFHLRFHAAFFRAQMHSLPHRMLFSAAWHMVGTAAALVVLWDHRYMLRTLQIPFSQMAATFHRLLRSAYHRSIDTRLRDELLGLPLPASIQSLK
jgi:rubrerythrin